MPQTQYFENFEGSIDNLTVHDLRKDLRKVMEHSDFKNRSEAVNKIIEKYDTFLTTYFSNIYNPHLTHTDVLSEGNNVCSTLSLLGTLLIKADNEELPYDKTYYDTSIV